MFIVFRLLYENFRKFDDEYRDRRSENYFLQSNPLQMLTLVLSYCVFVKYIGPKLMKDRKPFDLKYVLLVYNFLQVVISSYIALKPMYLLFTYKPYNNWRCMLPIKDNSHLGLLELKFVYTYLILKVCDYMDTIFFVLRKRNNQVTFLHLYHHIIVSVGTYVYMRYLPGGHINVMGVMNSFIHVVMYFYYFLCALQPGLKHSLWWKKYLTQAQILQFSILIIHFGISFFYANCSYPKIGLLFLLIQSIVMLVLFLDFYKKAYMGQTTVKRSRNSGHKCKVY